MRLARYNVLLVFLLVLALACRGAAEEGEENPITAGEELLEAVGLGDGNSKEDDGVTPVEPEAPTGEVDKGEPDIPEEPSEKLSGQSAEEEEDEDIKTSSSTAPPDSDWGCRYSFSEKRCQPAEHCKYQYRFLDATPSESCRLIGSKPQKHAVTGGLQVSPAVAVVGATTLFAADLSVIAFTPALKKAPLLFNVLQGFVLFVSGDTYFQVLEQKWGTKIGLNLVRSLRSGVIGAINNGLVHFSYYKWIDEHFPYHKFTVERWGPKDGTLHKLIVAWAKYWIEWPTIGLYKIASSFFLTALMSGDLPALKEKFQKRLMLTWLRSLQVWPIYDTILYAYVPTAHRPLFNTFMSIAWGGYLSHISQPEAKAGVTLETAHEGDREGGDNIVDSLKKEL